jgi:RNA polymerase sigma-70 factor, ECF subfamily
VRSLLDAGEVDRAATVALERYGAAVLKYLRLLLHDEQDAADAYSLFEEHLWRGLSTFRTESSLQTWVFRVARNAAADVHKQAWRRLGRRLTIDLANAAAADELETPNHVREMRRLFQRLRQYLSESEQTLLILRVEHEFRWTEIARILSRDGRALDTTTVIKRFDRLAARLCRMARQHGLLP